MILERATNTSPQGSNYSIPVKGTVGNASMQILYMKPKMHERSHSCLQNWSLILFIYLFVFAACDTPQLIIIKANRDIYFMDFSVIDQF